MSRPEEKFLDLPGGRVLAYEEAGNPNSKTIVIFFHGVFGVGSAVRPSPVLVKHDAHYITPTLPGWGNSTIRANPDETPYYVALAQDTAALLEHLHPGCSAVPEEEYKLYVTGGSFGTVAAQIIFNASLDVFPPGKHTVACLLLTPATPFKYHREYAKDLTWDNYIALKTAEDAEKLIRSLVFDHIKEDEKVMFEKWGKERGLGEGQLEKDMAANMFKSVSKYWDGFLETGDVMHSDWGFTPEEMNHKPVIIVTSKEDRVAPGAWGKWLATQYPNARLKETAGGHIAGLWSVDATWEELMVIAG